MKENTEFFSLADLKSQIGLNDELNDNILLYDFALEQDKQPLRRQSVSRANALTITVCTDGEASININAQDFVLKAGMAALILPNSLVNINSDKMTTRGSILSVSTTLMKEVHIDIHHIVPIGMHMFHNPCFHLSEQDMELYNRYIGMIRLISRKSDNHNIQMIQSLVKSLLVFIHEIMSREVKESGNTKFDKVNNRNMHLFDEFMHLLTENFRKEHQIGFYADHLCLTPKYLSMLIKQTSGRSVSDWIDYFIIMEAKALLRYSDLSIQQVAYALHFPTPSFFGTYFKRHVGMTPGDFREGSESEQ